ncbi:MULTISPECIES: polysaccharide deacetylase family protein [unclassified Streptomyces]|uniref:polysaccharide deacetylase family protein n=1 Tax=unclassified Streptomyces TaxID=2593676 RepID=UPI0006AF7638|nr:MULTISPECIES: polysaccharide deacetylase family protein [unclassified Streptomyces]KOX36270.1 oligosaccharide deacetylase [Streptomyces sp. NRRL F-6492]KOX36529.1 oligosaccharide deacetylase [Streptomyces sp. NRRL F-6491]
MKKDQMTSGRRAVLRLAAALGATTTVGVLAADRLAAPDRAADAAPVPRRTPGAGADQGAAGPAVGPRAEAARLGPNAYRLQPMTSHASPAYRRALPPVRRRPFLSVSGAGRSMVLTFDDGPDPRYTPGILDTLRRHDCRAMFFVCGEMAAENRDLLRRMAAEGHVVGNHSWSHPLITGLRPSRIRDELGSTSEVVERTLGTAPLWYRAPYGAWNRHSFEIGAELGMEPLAWTVDTLDWKEPGTDSIVRRVLDGAAPGVVVLNHDAGGDRSQSVAALRRYLPALLDAGYHLTVPRR